MSTQSHTTKFERNPVTGMHRATCTCGWRCYGPLEQCQRLAAGHDVTWEAVEVDAGQAAAVPA